MKKIPQTECDSLFAEMKVPGRAWLEFELKSASKTSTDLYISAIFDPNGPEYLKDTYHNIIVRVNQQEYTNDDIDFETLSPPDNININSEGICGVWSVIIAILLTMEKNTPTTTLRQVVSH